MFAKLFKIAAAATMVASVMATPLPSQESTDLVVRGSSHSFDNYMGIKSLSGFDNFYGSENFSGEISKTVIVKEQEVVCHSESVEIIQQRLLVLQEMAKRIISEQICEVETQTIVFEQSTPLRSVGYDSSIASHFGSIVSSSGSLSTSNLGFSGSDVGSHYVSPSGSNWNSGASPASVGSAFSAAQAAISSSS
ncbi:hypothetical protein BJ912DRAFT_1084683 [Pholiota molesta]|nr:hypothetical protein BJ912DRAFT_1084683 [Pholiota molesta]